MQLTAEISMYPLQDNYIAPIDGFIERLNSYDLRVTTYPTCTVVVGEHGQVMAAIGDAMLWSHNAQGKAVFVTKFIHDYQAV